MSSGIPDMPGQETIGHRRGVSANPKSQPGSGDGTSAPQMGGNKGDQAVGKTQYLGKVGNPAANGGSPSGDFEIMDRSYRDKNKPGGPQPRDLSSGGRSDTVRQV